MHYLCFIYCFFPFIHRSKLISVKVSVYTNLDGFDWYGVTVTRGLCIGGFDRIISIVFVDKF